jgi:hypothetical protein
MNVDWLDPLFKALVLGVGVALLVASARLWHLHRLSDDGSRRVAFWPLGLVIATFASYVFLLLSFPFTDFLLGTAFGKQRSVTLEINVGLAFVIIVVSIFKGGALRWPVALAATALLINWFIVAAWSVAV